jgi:hypothetical protein
MAELQMFLQKVGGGLFTSAIAALAYLGLEPYFRRFWPRQLVSWIRLLDARWKDPLVGRDVLAGVLFGIGFALVHDLEHMVPHWLGTRLPPLMSSFNPPTNEVWRLIDALSGSRIAIAEILGVAGSAMMICMVWAVLLTVLRVAVRKGWIACILWVLLFSLISLGGSGPPLLSVGMMAALSVLVLSALVRFGLLTLAVAMFVSNLAAVIPMTTDLTRWYTGGTAAAFVVLIVLVAYGIRMSVRARSAASQPAG